MTVEIEEAVDTALFVRAGSHRVALPLAHVLETMRPQDTERVAGVPGFVRGLARIRGAPVPVVDLGVLLGDGECGGRFVTVRAGERVVALAVDETFGVRRLGASSLAAMPPLLREASAADAILGIAALDGELWVVLRAARVVPDEAWSALDRRGDGGATGPSPASGEAGAGATDAGGGSR